MPVVVWLGSRLVAHIRAKPWCDRCQAEVDAVASFGDSVCDNHEMPAQICLACAKAAVAALEEAAGRDEVERILSRMDGDAA